MSVKNIHSNKFKIVASILTLALIIGVSITTLHVNAEKVDQSDTILNIYSQSETIDQNMTVFNYTKVVDCPTNVAGLQPSRTVLQVINNEFHKWNEYDLGTTGEFCILLVMPYEKALNEQEANDLLNSSKEWVNVRAESSKQETVLSPNDPTLNLPYKETPLTSGSITESAGSSVGHVLDPNYSADAKSNISNEVTFLNESSQGLLSKGDQLTDEQLAKLLVDHMQLVIEYETFNGVTNVEKKLIDESGIVVESDLLNNEATLIIAEEESNNTTASADPIDMNYYGVDDYEINGTITSSAEDIDYFQFRSSVAGELTINGEWISGLPSSSEWHEDLYIIVKNSSGTTYATSLINSGLENEMQQIIVNLKNGDYYIMVYASSIHGDRYIDEAYSLDMSFIAASDPPLSISQTQSYPYNTVGYATTAFDNGSYRGTAFLVSAFTALTNGHNVYDTSDNTWTNKFTLAPGQYISTVDGLVYQPYGFKVAYEVVTNDGYRASGETVYDYAAAHFSTPFNDIQTFMPLEFNVAPSFINVLGYPAMADGNWNSGMWHSYGNVVELTDRLIMYQAFSYGGSSGSPVYTYNGDTGLRRVIAVHGFGSSSYNGGIRFTSLNQALIEAWMQWEPATNIHVNGRIDLEHYDNSLNGVVDLTLSSLSNTYTAKTNTDGDFIIDAIDSGTYTLTIEENGYLTRTIDNIIVNTESITLSSSLNPIVLMAGDVDGITGINSDDLDYLISKLGLVDTDTNYDDVADFDKNNSIDAGDLAILIKNLDSNTSSYASWVW